MPCQRCGFPSGGIVPVFPSAADIATILEECPPHYFAAFAQAIRDHKAGRANGGAALSFDGSNGDLQDWHLERRTKLRGLKSVRRKA